VIGIYETEYQTEMGINFNLNNNCIRIVLVQIGTLVRETGAGLGKLIGRIPLERELLRPLF